VLRSASAYCAWVPVPRMLQRQQPAMPSTCRGSGTARTTGPHPEAGQLGVLRHRVDRLLDHLQQLSDLDHGEDLIRHGDRPLRQGMLTHFHGCHSKVYVDESTRTPRSGTCEQDRRREHGEARESDIEGQGLQLLSL
jgi:hypothetical protein